MSPNKSPGKGRRRAIRSVPDLLAHALAIERDAEERYGELADQMATHNNSAAEDLFRRLAQIESRHVQQIQEMCAGVEPPQRAPWEFLWSGGEGPEAMDLASVHYLLSPHEAVRLAMGHEARAEEFYRGVAGSARPAPVRQLARQLADEEAEHVRWLQDWLQHYPPQAAGADDPDPPMEQG
ncbi:Rubrerythrin [Burkholderiales bacterium]|nr:Rubrerythrin [Burkholderiales bacterium]